VSEGELDDGATGDEAAPEADPEPSREPRPIVERIGLACIALAIGAMFGGVGYAAWLGGEWFLAIIGLISWLMTWWVGILTLLRG